MKKLTLLVTVLACMTASLIAQPPPPPSVDPDSPHQGSINRTPVGTATLLMLGLGGAVLGYKLKSNSKREDDAE